MPAKKNRRAAQDVSRAFNPLPKFFTPMMAQRADQLPEGAEWTYELKLDGYRALLFQGWRTRVAALPERQGSRNDVSVSRRGWRTCQGKPSRR